LEVDTLAKKQFKTESKRLLELMINSIYTHKEIFLREIVSNASDAIDKLCYLALTDDQVGMSRSDFLIRIRANKDARTITVSDNGIGMTAEDLEKNLGVIANSGSLQFKSGLDEEKKAEGDINIIGQFGVGFYSAFMVSDKVEVISRAYGQCEAAKWSSAGVDGYSITPDEKETVGTDIIMHLKPDTEEENYSEFLEVYRLRQLIKKYSDYIRYPIKMDIEKSRPVETDETDEDGKKKTRYESYTEEETINSMIPIWQRSKSEVSDEDCAAFYKEKYYDPEEPAKIIRISAEGSAVSYKALLFIPKKAPYNYYTRDYEAGLQLYTSGVMIMEKCSDLLPECFRFVRGVVDSQDLSLNISREMLQHDRQLKVIASNIEKKVKSELKKLMTEDPALYREFYQSFGLQLKYGVLGDYGMKKDLLSDLLLFYSSNEKEPVSLADYVSKMPEEQKFIYFACGDRIPRLYKLPQAAPVQEKGFSILYLTEDPDEFVVNMLGDYEKKPFKSINSEDLGIESETGKEETEKQESENKELLDFVKDSLSGAVAAVKLSHKLKSHPVCLSAQGPISLEMERYFSSLPAGGEKLKAERVLELNANHKTFNALKLAFMRDKEKAAKYAKLLYFQSLLIAGSEIPDPNEYAELVDDLII
jgi:molecular chaperone HtpG